MASLGVGGVQRRAIACVSTSAGNISGSALLKRSNARSFRSANVSAIFIAPKCATRDVNASPTRTKLARGASDGNLRRMTEPCGKQRSRPIAQVPP